MIDQILEKPVEGTTEGHEALDGIADAEGGDGGPSEEGGGRDGEAVKGDDDGEVLAKVKNMRDGNTAKREDPPELQRKGERNMRVWF